MVQQDFFSGDKTVYLYRSPFLQDKDVAQVCLFHTGVGALHTEVEETDRVSGAGNGYFRKGLGQRQLVPLQHPAAGLCVEHLEDGPLLNALSRPVGNDISGV